MRADQLYNFFYFSLPITKIYSQAAPLRAIVSKQPVCVVIKSHLQWDDEELQTPGIITNIS
jgi:hypothetical protein